MEATQVFGNVLRQIETSNLNFKLELSPFSALISLRKSFIKDKSGNPLQPPSSQYLVVSNLHAENQNLRQKILQQELEITSLKSDCKNAVDDCEETYKVKTKLECEIMDLKSRIMNTEIKSEDVETCDILKRELSIKNDEIKNLFEQKETELKNISTKHEKLSQANSIFKGENSELEKELRNISVALKSTRKDLKDTVKKNDVEKSLLEKEITKMFDIKKKQENEARVVKKKERNIIKKKKKQLKKEAGIEVNKNEEQRTQLEKPNFSSGQSLELDLCLHSPQCLLRDPTPPALGPKTFKQTEIDNLILKTEEITQSFTKNVIDFMKQKPEETLDDTIDKLEALKAILEPENSDVKDESEFTELIQLVKNAKAAIDSIEKDEDEYDEDYFESMMDDNLPRHYWGGEDGNELIFLEDGDD